MSKLRKSRAFTLIELLVVVAIIGILATIIVINVMGAQRKARVNASLTNVNESLKVAAICFTNESTLSVPDTCPAAAGGSTTCTSANLTSGSGARICSDSTFSSTLWPIPLNANYSYSITFTGVTGATNRTASGISDTGVTLTMPTADLAGQIVSCNSVQCRLQ